MNVGWISPMIHQTYSWKYKCPKCGRIVYFNHGFNNKNGKGQRPECKYRFCPWCGYEVLRGVDTDERDG